MFSLNESNRYVLYLTGVSMRKGIEGLLSMPLTCLTELVGVLETPLTLVMVLSKDRGSILKLLMVLSKGRGVSSSS